MQIANLGTHISVVGEVSAKAAYIPGGLIYKEEIN